MSAEVTQILSEKGNIIFKSVTGDILKIMPSQGTFAHPSAAPNINIIQFNNSPDRLPSNESFYIKVDQITTPAGPWTQQTLLQELQDNYINAPISVEGLGDLATETTLAAIKSQTDLLTFTGPDLNVTGGGGGGGAAAEVTAFVTTALLASGATFASGVLDADGKTQVQTEISASHDGTITIYFCADAGGLDIVRTLSIPYTAANGYQFFAAPAFVNFIKYEFTNSVGAAQTDFYYTTKFLTTGLSPQLLTTSAFIAPAMVANLGRNIIVGQDENGTFGNVSVTDTVNDAGSYRNLNVVSGARPSQLAGRVKVSEVVDTTASVLQRTITAGKTFFITDIILTIDNTDQNNTGRVNLRDGLTVAGAIVLPIQVQEAPQNESATQVVTHTFSEPIEFSTGLFIEEGAGINTVTGVVIGYEE